MNGGAAGPQTLILIVHALSSVSLAVPVLDAQRFFDTLCDSPYARWARFGHSPS